MDFGRKTPVVQILEQNSWCQTYSSDDYRIVNRMSPYDTHNIVLRIFVIYEFLEAYCYRLIHILRGLSSLSGKTSYRQISWGKSRSREIGCYNDRIVLTFDSYLGSACQILERLEKFKPKSRGLETSRDPAVRRPSVYWVEAQSYFIGTGTAIRLPQCQCSNPEVYRKNELP